jgi:PhnB protein
MSNLSLNPYLSFTGNCAEALGFYAQCLGTKLDEVHHYAGSPMEKDLPPGWGNKVMHASLNWQGFRLMGADNPPSCYKHEGYKGITLSLSVDDTAQAERLFAALSAGGNITMPMAQTFWAKRFGMLTDRFGVSWMVNCE